MAKKKKESILIDDISKQIAETKKVLADAQKSLAEKTAEVSDLKARLKQLEKTADLPVDIKSITGKWYKNPDGTDVDKYNKRYFYVIKDHGFKTYTDGTVYRKLTLFDVDMELWDSKDIQDSIGIWKEITELFGPEDINNFIPVKLDEIKNEISRNFNGIFKTLNGKNILPDEFKPFIKQKKKVKKNG